MLHAGARLITLGIAFMLASQLQSILRLSPHMADVTDDIDLSQGPVELEIGGPGNPQWLHLHKLHLTGRNPQTPATPLFRIRRRGWEMPNIRIQDCTFASEGSVLEMHCAGVLSSVRITTFGKPGAPIDYEGWSDIGKPSTPFGLHVDDVDGVKVDDLRIETGHGHGVTCTRWHKGWCEARVRLVSGSAFKMQQVAGVRFEPWAEANRGYGMHLRDCGIDRLEFSSHPHHNEGGTLRADCWFEANNGRTNAWQDSQGYRFSQFKLENCARLEVGGHSGALWNQLRADRPSRDAVAFREEYGEPPMFVNAIQLPSPRTSNWWQIWTDDRYRPVVTDSLTITYPPGCFHAARPGRDAWWKMFSRPLASPGTFQYQASVADMTGDIAARCACCEDSMTPRVTPCFGTFVLSVGRAVNSFPLWSLDEFVATGACRINQARTDLNLHFNAVYSGFPLLEMDRTTEYKMRIDYPQLSVVS